MEANLSAHKLRQLQLAWGLYEEAVSALRQQQAGATAQLQWASNMHCATWLQQDKGPGGATRAQVGARQRGGRLRGAGLQGAATALRHAATAGQHVAPAVRRARPQSVS